jgi:ribosomal protein L11 methyltransferase
LFSLLLHPTPDREDFLTADLWEFGAAGIAEEEAGMRAFFEGSANIPWLLDRLAEFRPDLREEATVDWAQAARDAWPPLAVGKRFYLVPPWSEAPTPDGRLRLEIEPGMACGTGRHPATQLCLEAIERYLQPGSRVVDVGTGSGILARAAALLGAGSVIGCDIDPEAVEIARGTLGVTVFIGSAAALGGRAADLILANIDAAALEQIRDELARVRKPHSIMILSGFPEDDIPPGFAARQVLRKDGWACLIC